MGLSGLWKIETHTLFFSPNLFYNEDGILFKLIYPIESGRDTILSIGKGTKKGITEH